MTYFEKHRATANGIMYVGETAAGMLYPNLLLHLQETYSFRSTLLIYGAITLHATAFCLFIRVSPSLEPQTNPNVNISPKVLNPSSSCGALTRQGTEPEPYPSFLYALRLFKVPMFYVILMLGATVHFSQIIFITTIVDYAADKGFPEDVGTLLILYASPGDTFGRIILPYATDRKCMSQSTLVLCCYFAMSLALFVAPHASSLALLIAVCVLFEMFLGCLLTSKIIVVAENVEPRLFGYCIGLLGLAAFPLLIASPSIIGECAHSSRRHFTAEGG